MQMSSVTQSIELTEPRLARLFSYWDRKRGARVMPARADLDPLEMKEWLGNLVLIDVMDDGEFVYRLYGTEFVEKFGVEMTGHGVDELPPEQRERIRADYMAVCKIRQPRGRIYTALFESPTIGLGVMGAPQMATWERLVLPLSNDGERVTMLLVGAYKLPDLKPSTA